MAKGKKSSKKSSSLKDKCDCLAMYCRDCYGDVIDMLCVCDEKSKKLLCEYLKCCLALCECCCCICMCINMNCCSAHQMSDLVSKCNSMCSVCDKLKKVLTPAQYKKINCIKVKDCCSKICGTKKSTKKSKKGGAIRMPSEYYGKNSGRYFSPKDIKTSYDTFYGKSVGKSFPNTNLAPGPGFENMRGGGKCRLA